TRCARMVHPEFLPLRSSASTLVRRDEGGAGGPNPPLLVSSPAEFLQVTADSRRMQQIATAGGGHVLYRPADAFANDLPPLTTPVPLQRVLVLIAAILLPLEGALRRLRLSPADLVSWRRHPPRVALGPRP